MARKRKNAIVYARSATDKGNALAVQSRLCQTWARAHGYTITGEYSEVASGLAWRLPEQAKAIAQAAGDGAALICVDPDRLSRDVGRLAEVMVICVRRGVVVHFAEG
jgi:DNA invertase Pin-like site-specific DNA recombinase